MTPSSADISSMDRFSAYFYSATSLYAAGRTAWSLVKFQEACTLEKGLALFVDTVYLCASTVTFIYTANKVRWLSWAIPHKFERTLNFSSLIIQIISGEHSLKVRTPGVDPYPMIRQAYVVATVIFAVLEVITLFYVNSVTNALYCTFMVTSFSLLGVGSYLTHSSPSPGAAPNAAP